MKKLLLFSFIFSALLANAQTSVYKPFPTTSANWLYRFYDQMHNPTLLGTQYVMNGDTLISSAIYKKIFKNSVYAGALRESSKTIYFVPDTSVSEYLLYDFNLQAGDTVVHPFGGAVCTNDTLTIAFIDSVQLSDGYHKQFWFNPIGPPWIEGVGSIEYLLEPLQTWCVSGNDLLECMVNDTVFHFPANQSSCVLTTEKTQESLSEINIFPNPSFFGAFTIDFKNAEIKEIFISDLPGKVVFHQQNAQQIKVENLPAGTYFLNAIDNNGKQVNRKIIISR